MGLGYKFFKNYMLPFSAIFFFASLAGLALSLTQLSPEYLALVKDFNIWVLVLSAFIGLVAGWYFFEQIYLRWKLGKTLSPEKKSDVAAMRRTAEELVRRLPDSYRKRLESLEFQSRSRRQT